MTPRNMARLVHSFCPRALRSLRTRLSSLPSARKQPLSSTPGGDGTYYNSQLGQHIRISGAMGIRIHDVTVADSGKSELISNLCRVRPTTIDIGDISLLAEDQLQKLAVAMKEDSAGAIQLVAGVADISALGRWAAVSGIDAAQKMASVTVSCKTAQNSPEDVLATAREIVAASHDMGIQVKARIQDAFTDSEGETTDPYTVHDVVLGLADIGTDVLIVTDSFARADVDEVVEMVEALLWFDVSGESMMERLGFRGSLEGSLAAAQLGVTHFEAAALHNSGDFVGAKELAKALAEADKKVHLDWQSL